MRPPASPEAGKRPAARRDQARYTPREPSATKATRPRRGESPGSRGNRRITVQTRSPVVWLGEVLPALGKRRLVVG